jgi:hypothetical protein
MQVFRHSHTIDLEEFGELVDCGPGLVLRDKFGHTVWAEAADAATLRRLLGYGPPKI